MVHSGTAISSSATSAREAGFDAYLAKPVGITDLEAVIAESPRGQDR